jgi:hypothetical protein
MTERPTSPSTNAEPPSPSTGLRWLRLAMLGYLAFFFVQPASEGASALEWAATAAASAAFVALYALAFRVTGWRLLLAVGAIAALGLGFVPFNWGAPRAGEEGHVRTCEPARFQRRRCGRSVARCVSVGTFAESSAESAKALARRAARFRFSRFSAAAAGPSTSCGTAGTPSRAKTSRRSGSSGPATRRA